MARLLIYFFAICIAATVTIAHCKHKNREVFYPSPNNEKNVNIEDLKIPIEINDHHKKNHKSSPNTLKDNHDYFPDVIQRSINRRKENPDENIYIEYDDNRKIELDNKQKIKIKKNDYERNTHKIIKKDRPEWYGEDRYIRDIGHSRNKNFGRHDSYRNNDPYKAPTVIVNIEQDHSDDSRNKKEIVQWDIKNIESKTWTNDNHEHGLNHNNNLNIQEHNQDPIYDNRKDFKVYYPELEVKGGAKSGDSILKYHDNLHGLIVNATKSHYDLVHDIESDYLNLNWRLKPIGTIKTGYSLADVNAKDSGYTNQNYGQNVGFNVRRRVDPKDIINDQKIGVNYKTENRGIAWRDNINRRGDSHNGNYDFIYGVKKDPRFDRIGHSVRGNREHSLNNDRNYDIVWGGPNDYQLWPDSQHKIKLYDDNHNVYWGTFKDVSRWRSEKHRTTSKSKNNSKRWHINIRDWKLASSDNSNADENEGDSNRDNSSIDVLSDSNTAGVSGGDSGVDGSADNEDVNTELDGDDNIETDSLTHSIV